MATERDALSPPTMAFAFTASSKLSMYFKMMYTLDGSVPSVGLALPTLMGSVFPTSQRRAMDVIARSSANSSLNSGRDGSVASSNLSNPFCTCVCIQRLLSLAVAVMASRGFKFWWITFHATRVKNSPPISASSLRCVNIIVLAAAATSSSLWKAERAAALRIAIALELPPSLSYGTPCPTCCAACLVWVHNHAPQLLETRAFQTGMSLESWMGDDISCRPARNSSIRMLYSP
mmetsp:Transcript_35243/g.59390  ORF Transcript_35243/g.59390 Transcript_35243/m.59390 type:complete len:233 (+) Transcript_35243:444-1142(+)